MAVKWLAGQKKISLKRVGELIGYNNASSFSQVLNSKRDVPSTFPERIASLDPRINVDFLLGTSEEMLLPGNPQPEPETPPPFPDDRRRKAPEGVLLPMELVQMFTDLSATVRSQQETIRMMVEAARVEPKKDVG